MVPGGHFNFEHLLLTSAKQKYRQRFRADGILIPHLRKALHVVRHYMRPYFRIAIGLIIIWFGIKAIRQAFGGYDLGLFYQFQYIPFGLLIIFTFAALLFDTTYYKFDKRLYQYVTSFIGLTLCGIVTFKIIQRNSVDNSETVLQVSNLPGATNVLTFEFKTNKKFRLTEYDKLGQTVYYGKYDKLNDTIFIRDNNYNGYVKELPKTATIRADTVYWTRFDTMLIDKK